MTRPIPDYLQPIYATVEDLAAEFGLTVAECSQTLQAARVPSLERDGHLWFAEVMARAKLASPRQLAMLDEQTDEMEATANAEPAEQTIAAGTLPVGSIRFRSVGFREGDDD